MSMDEKSIAELSRLRAFALRIGPVVKAALELRELGRSLERLEEEMHRRNGLQNGTRSATPWLILNQAYETALQEFDAKVKRAALGDFIDLLGDTYDIFDPKKIKRAQSVSKSD